MLFKSHEPKMDGYSNVLVVALLGEPIDKNIWLWDMLARVRPQLCELIAMTDTRLPCPDFDKAMTRNFRLKNVMKGRERVVLVSSLPSEETPGEITRWHVRPEGVECFSPPVAWTAAPFHLAPVKQQVPRAQKGKAPLLPYWLEEQMPAEGLDCIQLPWPVSGRRFAKAEAREPRPAAWMEPIGHHASAEFFGPHAASLRVTCSALLGILWEIVREVGSPQMRQERGAARGETRPDEVKAA